VREWQAESSISILFRTSIRLQSALDRCFSQFGVTAQEAAVLLRCAEQGEPSAGKLARAIRRDKATITRFVKKLEAHGFLCRKNYARDHGLSIIKTTNRGTRVAPDLKARFEEVWDQFFEGVLNIAMGRPELCPSKCTRMPIVCATKNKGKGERHHEARVLAKS
jgi:DNA-binding MarR family transcriptional regulator